MNVRKILSYLLFTGFCLSACHSTKHLSDYPPVNDTISNPSLEEKYTPFGSYNPSYHIINDIINTTLEVGFDWEKQHMPGKATITFHPHFYPTDSLTLDAKGFDIHKIEIVTPKGNKELLYFYDSTTLRIFLDRTYSRDENYTVQINYRAKPNERKTEGSAAITDSKGLYFINPKGEDPNKPKQIWTQGETENNSAWFPTIDKPNMKTTIEIFMKVDSQYVTLSNGLMLDSRNNNDGTRTDHWKLDQPIAPYLVMMAVGKFSIIKDKWRNIDVNYYVEPKYAPYAKEIFGDTPKMLEFYSKTLGVDYAWSKFSQIIVRDFVSGAMENVSAVVHYSALHQTHREMIDGNHEDIICHELFHHWFGNLVTCESWANLPLNESFADFGESLWLRHKYGNDEGDYHIHEDLGTYLRSSEKNLVPLIRYFYSDKEDMFDANSYQKGGCVLNLLHTYIGDKAFYKALNIYLTANKFKTGEIHQLRLAFEEVTGEDLNWFFNQWFLGVGHPKVTIDYNYDALAKKETVTIEQNQTVTGIPVFRLPLKVDVYSGGEVKQYNIVMDQQSQTFFFPVFSKPDLVNIDADKSMIWTKTDNKSDSNFVFQYYHAPLMLDRLEAIEYFEYATDTSSQKALLAALQDKFWRIREEAIDKIDLNKESINAIAKATLLTLAQSDPKSQVRATALKKLSELNDKSMMSTFEGAMKDSSYLVLGTALDAIFALDQDKAFDMAKQMQNEEEGSLTSSVANIFAEKGGAEQNDWFLREFKSTEGFRKFSLYSFYGKFLGRMNENIMNNGLTYLFTAAQTETPWLLRFGSMNAISTIKDDMENKIDSLKTETSSEAKSKLIALTAQVSSISTKMDEIKSQESDKTLRAIYGK